MIVPSGGIDVRFLKSFSALVRRSVKRGDRFVIVTGGGSTARHYIEAGSRVTKISHEDLDWLGIHATRLNAHLVRTILRDVAYPVVVKSTTESIRGWKKPVLVAAGEKPGRSTDDVATRLARRFGARTVVNISNVDVLYDKDPRTHKDAKPVKEMSWKEYRRMVGNKWSPGLSAPFDPVASKLAQTSHIRVVLVGGRDVANIGKVLKGKPFKGSVIQ